MLSVPKVKVKSILMWIYAWHILSFAGIVLLGADVLTGYNPPEIDLISGGHGFPEIATETDKAIGERKRIYHMMRIGLFLALVDNVIRIPPIANLAKKWESGNRNYVDIKKPTTQNVKRSR